MEIPRYIVIKLEMVGKDAVKATEITDRCEVYEYEADEDEPQKDCKKCKNYDRCKNNRWKCCVYEPKDEPQTERSSE